MIKRPADILKRPTDNEMYALLRDGKIQEFNRRKVAGESTGLAGCSLRGIDLRELDASDLDLSNCYLRYTNLQGIDFSSAHLEGASIHDAMISGVLFPSQLSAEEIRMSHALGTRMRYC